MEAQFEAFISANLKLRFFWLKLERRGTTTLSVVPSSAFSREKQLTSLHPTNFDRGIFRRTLFATQLISARAFLGGKSNPTSQNPPPKSSIKSHQAPFIDASVKESWLPKQFRKCRWVTWLKAFLKVFRGRVLPGWDSNWRLEGRFCVKKKWFIERKNQQIMKFQKGVLFKHIVHWKKLMTRGTLFSPKVCGLKRVSCQCKPLKVPSSAQFLVPKGNQRFNKLFAKSKDVFFQQFVLMNDLSGLESSYRRKLS